MDRSKNENSPQVLHDHRRLMVGFALLVVLCGSFYVIGFMQGKQQAGQRAENASDSRPSADSPEGTAGEQAALPAQESAKPPEEQPPLGWYQSVNRKSNETAKSAEGVGRQRVSPRPPGKSEAAVAAGVADPADALVVYSVQVGAFRNLKEAEARAAMLKAKKYSCFIEFSGPPDQLHLLKVGRFESRADAAAMQQRLKRDGFSTFIKASRQ